MGPKEEGRQAAEAILKKPVLRRIERVFYWKSSHA